MTHHGERGPLTIPKMNEMEDLFVYSNKKSRVALSIVLGKENIIEIYIIEITVNLFILVSESEV